MSHLSASECWPSYVSEEGSSGRHTHTQIFPWQLPIIKWLFEAVWFEMLDTRAVEIASRLCAHEPVKRGLVHTFRVYYL